MGLYNFDEFCEEIRADIMEYLPKLPNAAVYIRKVTKNNGITLTALQIFEEGTVCTPSIYLESYYEKYIEGEDLDSILEKLAAFYLQHENEISVDVGHVNSFSHMKEKLIFRLVNYEMNAEELKNCPYLMWQDLAVTFRWLAFQDELGVASALVTNRELREWDTCAEELYRLAINNMISRFPPCCQPIEDILMKRNGDEKGYQDFQTEIKGHKEDTGVYMLVLTNRQKINGASSVVYPGILKDIAEKYDTSFCCCPAVYMK